MMIYIPLTNISRELTLKLNDMAQSTNHFRLYFGMFVSKTHASETTHFLRVIMNHSYSLQQNRGWLKSRNLDMIQNVI